MKVLLVESPLNPKSVGSSLLALGGFPEPLALEILAASIPNHDVRILDMRIEDKLDQTIAEFQPDIVGTGALTAGITQSKNVLKRVKSINAEITTIMGGHHATVQPEDFIEPYIDLIVSGEGDITFPELINAMEVNKDLKQIKGLCLHHNGNLISTGPRELINMDMSPIPDRNLTKQYRSRYFRGQWKSMSVVISSRGCPHRCDFCAMWRIYDGKYRVRSAESVMDEIESLPETFIDFVDDNTLEDVKRIAKIINLIKDRQIKKEYKVYARSDTIVENPRLFEDWARLGLRMVLIGVESFRDNELELMNKASTVKKNEEALNILEKNGIEALSYIMVRPDYTDEDFDSLINYVQKKNIKQPVFSVYTPFPGTTLYNKYADVLSNKNSELFDCMHSLLPTTLPLERFYHNFANLYRSAYLKEIPSELPEQQKEAIKRMHAFLESIYQRMENAYLDHVNDSE